MVWFLALLLCDWAAGFRPAGGRLVAEGVIARFFPSPFFLLRITPSQYSTVLSGALLQYSLLLFEYIFLLLRLTPSTKFPGSYSRFFSQLCTLVFGSPSPLSADFFHSSFLPLLTHFHSAAYRSQHILCRQSFCSMASLLSNIFRFQSG